MTSPETVFAEAVTALDDRDTHAILPDRHRINPDIVAHPIDGHGYVYGQIGWLDRHGTTYGLRLPDTLDRDGTELRPLYICLGRHDRDRDTGTPGVHASEPEPCT